MRIDVFTLFPGWFDWFREQRPVSNALGLGHEFNTIDMRAATPLTGGQVDDTPYGGGAGMVIRVDVVEAALQGHYGCDPVERAGRARVVALAASGRQLDEQLVSELAAEPELTVLCGRYEGFDERVHDHLSSDVVSIGPYVLSGGEVAAMTLCDAVIRKLPGALGHEDSAVEESFSQALGGAPEYPHYTRPAEWRGHPVPEILVSGDHGRIREWRLEQSRARMNLDPPDGSAR
ncbi:MAG: tRNA (guanine37-N1)-methyltransferase [Thermoleophilaceae bacterium]|jgi:tRNA (guanine37-N1)-methyltransferase|nr:tRNA (guanine37-N1)-methyltransferase [Thermoleophilaceae bacterium]